MLHCIVKYLKCLMHTFIVKGKTARKLLGKNCKYVLKKNPSKM